MTELLHRKLTGQIIGVYYDVYNGLARTYPELIYERAMTDDLRRKEIRCYRQEKYEVVYKEKKVGEQHLDLFVADEVVVEIKVAPELTKLHKAQAFSYLTSRKQKCGAIVQFWSSRPGI